MGRPRPAQRKTRLTRSEAVRDARHMVRLLELSHPDPYTPMGGKVAFKRIARDLVASIPETGLDVAAFAEVLERFLARLHDGHTHLRSKGFRWPHPKDALPVDFGVHLRGLYVAGHDIAALSGTLGFRVSAVNDKTIPQLLKALAVFTAVENQYQGYTKLRHVLMSPALLARLIPSYRPGQPLRFSLAAPSGKKTVRTVTPSGPAKRRTGPVHKTGPMYQTGPAPWARSTQGKWRQPPRFWKRLSYSAEPFYYRFFDRESVAYFRVRNIMGREGFELAYRNNWGRPRKFIARFYKRRNKPVPSDIEKALAGIPSFLEKGEALLKEMKRRRTQTLIVDLQGNGGGVTPMVFPFLYMLHGDRFYGHRFPIQFVTVQSRLYLEKRRTTEAKWRKKTGNPLFQVGEYSFSGESTGTGLTARQKREKQIRAYKSKKLSFAARLEALNGKAVWTPRKIVVLCDSATFSAAFHFMFFLRDLGAHVVGIPSGQAPNAFMEVTPFVLPVSGLEGSISNSAQIFLPENPGARVFPVDFPLTYKILGRYGFSPDASLRYAVDLVKAGRLKR